ncbi:MAG: hypothetical protein ACI8XB_001497 [Patiriisocius sp.]|jgi:hypothetical protein
MKRILQTRILILAMSFAIIGSGFAQKRIESSAINMEFLIPNRFMKISEDKKSTIYQDNKTKAILSMEKLGFSDFETEILLQVEMDFNDIMSDDNNIDVEESSQLFRISSGYIIDWKTKERTRYRDNDTNRQALMQLNGTLYRFTISYPLEKRRPVLSLFNKTLNSAIPIYE